MQGEARANAILKCVTKAKRRVTLSLCGLGFLDEEEVRTLEGVQTFDAEAETMQLVWRGTPSIRDLTAPDVEEITIKPHIG